MAEEAYGFDAQGAGRLVEAAKYVERVSRGGAGKDGPDVKNVKPVYMQRLLGSTTNAKGQKLGVIVLRTGDNSYGVGGQVWIEDPNNMPP